VSAIEILTALHGFCLVFSFPASPACILAQLAIFEWAVLDSEENGLRCLLNYQYIFLISWQHGRDRLSVILFAFGAGLKANCCSTMAAQLAANIL
jgi:hypothetical protein